MSNYQDWFAGTSGYSKSEVFEYLDTIRTRKMREVLPLLMEQFPTLLEADAINFISEWLQQEEE